MHLCIGPLARVGLYTILLLPILYVERQNREAGRDPYTAHYRLQHTTGGGCNKGGVECQL